MQRNEESGGGGKQSEKGVMKGRSEGKEEEETSEERCRLSEVNKRVKNEERRERER